MNSQGTACARKKRKRLKKMRKQRLTRRMREEISGMREPITVKTESGPCMIVLISHICVIYLRQEATYQSAAEIAISDSAFLHFASMICCLGLRACIADACDTGQKEFGEAGKETEEPSPWGKRLSHLKATDQKLDLSIHFSRKRVKCKQP